MDQSHISPRQRLCVVGHWCRAAADTQCSHADHNQRSDAHTVTSVSPLCTRTLVMSTRSLHSNCTVKSLVYQCLSASYGLAQKKKWNWLPFHQFCLICIQPAWIHIKEKCRQHHQTSNSMYIARPHRKIARMRGKRSGVRNVNCCFIYSNRENEMTAQDRTGRQAASVLCYTESNQA